LLLVAAFSIQPPIAKLLILSSRRRPRCYRFKHRLGHLLRLAMKAR
jgi:hypothetical protein